MRKRYLFYLEYGESPYSVLFLLAMFVLAFVFKIQILAYVGIIGIFLIPYFSIIIHQTHHTLLQHEKKIMLSSLKSLRASIKGDGLTNRNKHFAVEKFNRLIKYCPSSVLVDNQIKNLISQVERLIDGMPMKPYTAAYSKTKNSKPI